MKEFVASRSTKWGDIPSGCMESIEVRWKMAAAFVSASCTIWSF